MPLTPQSGRLRVSEDCPSVLVRLMDGPRQGQVEAPAGLGPGGLQDLRLPGYIAHLGAKHLTAMRKEVRNKTYAQVSGKGGEREGRLLETHKISADMSNVL